jgi:hypothetical protein
MTENAGSKISCLEVSLRRVSIGQKNYPPGLARLAPLNPQAPIDDKLDRRLPELFLETGCDNVKLMVATHIGWMTKGLLCRKRNRF